MMATPLQCGHQFQLNNSKDTCALLTATTPLLQGHQYQLNDYASSTPAERHCNEGNNCHCNSGKDACTSKATTPSWQGQQCHHDDGKDACASNMTRTPLQ
jgi:hypothetical protein